MPALPCDAQPVGKRTRSIQARCPQLLPAARGRFYTAPTAARRGPRPRHERLLPNDACPCGSGRKFKKCHRGASPAEVAALGTAATLDHGLAAARPLFLDPDVEGFPLIRSGSCWLLSFRGDMWILSSNHAFTNQRLSPEQTRVFLNVETGRLGAAVRLAGEYVRPVAPNSHDDVWTDFVLVRCADPPPAYLRLLDLDRGGLADLDAATPAHWVRIFGFANVMGNAVDYEEARITIGSCSFDGRYAGPTESKYVHAVRFESTGHVNDFNGMSGGPAFMCRPGAEPWAFAGIVITGDARARVARFVDARRIEATLRWHYDANPSARVDASKRRAWVPS